MSEPSPPTPVPGGSPSDGLSAGAMLRAAREAHGLDLDQLALLLKVPVPKLEALESDRLDALPGIAFVRGLATAIARQLGVDAQPILAALPVPDQAPDALETVTRGLATPYREPGSRSLPLGWPGWLRPSILLPLLLILAAAAFWLLPPMRSLVSEPVAAAASAIIEPVASGVGFTLPADGSDLGGAVPTILDAGASAVVETVHSVPPDEPAASQPQATAAGSVVLRTTAESWIEVRDGGDSVLLSRMLPAGEVIGLDGRLPMRLKIGNAAGTRLQFRGESVDLSSYTRDNVARVELK